jgi:large subunit GTPase 1
MVKRVSVSSTPGKTKHLQTLIYSADLMLCDCPGLVFPSFLSSKAEMVLCGVLNCDNLTDFQQPIELLCLQVHSTLLEKRYKIKLGGRVGAEQFLSHLARERGHFTGCG